MTTNQSPIRVMTVDDHEIMRNGIRFVLFAFDDLELVGESQRGEDAVEFCRQYQPDVVLVDMKMSGMDGIETTAALKQAVPDVQVLILTSYHDSDLVRRAMQAGASGYFLKDTNKEDLAAAIRAAHAGKKTFSKEAAEDLFAATDETAVSLTEREIDVITLLAQGLSNKQIGKQLHRSPFTVRHHVSQLIGKLGAANRAQVAALAIEKGLIRKAPSDD